MDKLDLILNIGIFTAAFFTFLIPFRRSRAFEDMAFKSENEQEYRHFQFLKELWDMINAVAFLLLVLIVMVIEH